MPPEILYFLSTDKDTKVRCAVARNPETPIQADVILSEDKVVQVRLALSEKVAQLLPDLRPEQNEKITEMAYAILETLSVDQDKQVRMALANSVKSIGTVPKAIALTLAQDAEDDVALPILEYSSLLDDNDLMGLIVGELRQARLAALARRTELSGSLSEAVAETRDLVAISSLLRNESAQISEKSFDILLEGAGNSPKWLDILAVRSSVPEGTLMKLVRMASGALREKIQARLDLGDAFEPEVNAPEVADNDSAEHSADSGPESEDKELERLVDQMYRDGKLTSKAVMKAVKDKNFEFVSVAMAKIASVPSVEVRQVFSMSSAKSVLALAWRCEFDIKDAVILQRDVAKIPQSKILGTDSKSEYPLSENELSWQSDLIFSA